MKRYFALLCMLLCASFCFATSVPVSSTTFTVDYCVGSFPCGNSGTFNSSTSLTNFAGMWNISMSGDTILATLTTDYIPNGSMYGLTFTPPAGIFVHGSTVSGVGLVGGAIYGTSAFGLTTIPYNSFIASGTTFQLTADLSDQQFPVQAPEPCSLTIMVVGAIALLSRKLR